MENSKLAEALAKAQGQFRTPTLNRTAKIKNGQGTLLYETHYADLQECIDCIRKPLSENGLSFVQTVEILISPKEMWVLKLLLMHASGDTIQSILPLNVSATPQQLGGALTYFKRYQLSAFFGLAADFDDDGNAAEGKGNKVELQADKVDKMDEMPDIEQYEHEIQQYENKDPKEDRGPTEKQLKRLFAIAKASHWTHENIKYVMKGAWNIESTKDLSPAKYDILCSLMGRCLFENALKELGLPKAEYIIP